MMPTAAITTERMAAIIAIAGLPRSLSPSSHRAGRKAYSVEEVRSRTALRRELPEQLLFAAVSLDMDRTWTATTMAWGASRAATIASMVMTCPRIFEPHV